MIRISVSDLDQFRRYEETEEMTFEDFVAGLRKETPPTPQMIAGRALHKLLEKTTSETEFVSAERDGFNFFFECDIEMSLPIVRELKGEITIYTSVGPVTLVGFVDGMDDAIYDYKLSGHFDAERYNGSYQWRCYLMMFKGRRFVYRVFVGKERANGTGFDNKPFSEWAITEYHELPLYAYPGMEDDVAREVDRFARLLVEHAPTTAQAQGLVQFSKVA